MSTSHYSNKNYRNLDVTPIKSSDPNPSPVPLTPYHGSVFHSRPAATDAGSGTIKLHYNRRRRSYRKLLALLVAGIALLLLDGYAIAKYSDTVFEATVFSLLTIPASLYVISCAFAIKHRI